HFHCDLPHLIDLDEKDTFRFKFFCVFGERFDTPSLCSSVLHAQSFQKNNLFPITLHETSMFMFLCCKWFQKFSSSEILEDGEPTSIVEVRPLKQLQMTLYRFRHDPKKQALQISMKFKYRMTTHQSGLSKSPSHDSRHCWRSPSTLYSLVSVPHF
ncbi:hypothetical protein GOP47_0002156, partial [Adiantum capillus-veneris]